MDLIRENIVMIYYDKGPTNFHLLYENVEIKFHKFWFSELDFGGLFLCDTVKLWNLNLVSHANDANFFFYFSCQQYKNRYLVMRFQINFLKVWLF